MVQAPGPPLSSDCLDCSLCRLDGLAHIEEGADDGRVEQRQSRGDQGGRGGIRRRLWRWHTWDQALGEKEESKQALQHPDTPQTLLCNVYVCVIQFQVMNNRIVRMLPEWHRCWLDLTKTCLGLTQNIVKLRVLSHHHHTTMQLFLGWKLLIMVR